MRVVCNASTLALHLQQLNKVVAAKPTLPILGNVRIEATPEQRLEFFATDQEISFSTKCQATVTETGTVTLPAKKLLDLVEQLPGADLIMITEGNRVLLSSGAFRSRMQTLPVDDFPLPLSASGDSIALPVAALQAMVAKVRFAISDRSKYVVNGALMTVVENTLALVATDGKRLSLVRLGLNGIPLMSVIIPTKTLEALVTMVGGTTLEFSQSGRHLFFASGDQLLISRTIEATFPNYASIIPRDHQNRAIVDRVAFIGALRRVGLMSEENQACYCLFEASQLSLTTQSVSTGEAVENLRIDYDGPTIKMCFSWQFVLDFLEAAVEPRVMLCFQDASLPLLLTDAQESFINVVMLMRV